jgi:hypothetical protein
MFVGCGGAGWTSKTSQCFLVVTVVDDSLGTPLRGVKVVIDSPLTHTEKDGDTDLTGRITKLFACEGHPSLELTVIASDLKANYFVANQVTRCGCVQGEKQIEIRLKRKKELPDTIPPAPPPPGDRSVINE